MLDQVNSPRRGNHATPLDNGQRKLLSFVQKGGGDHCPYAEELKGWRVSFKCSPMLLVHPIIGTVLRRTPLPTGR